MDTILGNGQILVSVVCCKTRNKEITSSFDELNRCHMILLVLRDHIPNWKYPTEKCMILFYRMK